jgi:hypothetical protein
MIEVKSRKIKIEENAIAKERECKMLFHVRRKVFETGTG